MHLLFFRADLKRNQVFQCCMFKALAVSSRVLSEFKYVSCRVLSEFKCIFIHGRSSNDLCNHYCRQYSLLS